MNESLTGRDDVYFRRGKRLALKCCALAVLVAALLLFSKDSTKALFAPPSDAQDGPHLPTVVRVDSEGTPLRIVNTFVEARGSDRIVIRVMVQNQSAKKVRALAIAADSRIDFRNLSGAASVILPTQIKVIDISYAEEGRPKRVRVSVDFVEFEDGTTWGTDAGNSKDTLAGQRAGAKAERQRLKNLLKSKGRPAISDLSEVSRSDEPAASDVTGRSPEWLQGYRSGVGSIRHRVRQAIQASNPNQVEVELNKAFDTSEDNRQ